MSVSTNGQIFFGVAFAEDFEFPWGEVDLEDWWCTENGYKSFMKIYNTDGNYVFPRPSATDIEQYYQERKKFDESHPLPIELVNYCSSEYPMWALAVPGTLKTNYRGEAVSFAPWDLNVNPIKFESFEAFCWKYKIDFPQSLSWLLTSYWG